MSTQNKWITAHRDTDLVSKEDFGLAQGMTGLGNCYGKVAVETFFETITLGTLLRNTLSCSAKQK